MSNLRNEQEEVVISGVAGWFPGCSRSLSELSQHLLDNEYLVQQQQRWRKTAELGEEPLFGSIGDYGDFDHAFFGMHQKLAYWTDPAARLCIERSFEAIIDAGLSPRELKGSKTNVYVSSTFSDFEALMLDHFEAPSGYAIAGMSRTMIPNRISYFYDFKGQSCGFDGNWPWGELGLQMAQDAIRNGYCDAALVLASSVIHRPERNAHCRPAGLISEDGLCRSFDAQASGGQRSDAVVCFVVQRAARAKRCYARVVASRCGVAGPVDAAGDPLAHNPRGIERLLRGFYRDCGEDPNQVAYLEADGSGCKLWEEAELEASGEVMACGQRSGGRPLLVGSVKSNVGHTDGCAGMLAVAKLIVAMETGVLPATINHATPNDNVAALRDGRLKVVTSNTALEVDGDTLLAATTLGLGGAVGHVLVKPNPKAKACASADGALPRIVTVSGRSEEGVLASLKQVQSKPFDPEYLRLVQDAFTDIKGHTVRGFTVVPPLRKDAPVYKVNTSERRPLVLIYSGMGSQWPGMGRDLMALPVFGDTIERLHRVLVDRDTGLDLKRIMSNEDADAFEDIMNSFVGITASQIALTNVLTALGLSPDLLIGHSLGELGCGYADGCLTEEQTILASYVRGKAAADAKLPKGMMAALGVGYRDVEARLPASLDVACHNSASSCTLAGPADDVEAFVAQLQAEGVFARAVNASGIAFHSRYVRPAAAFVMQGLRSVIPEPRPRSSRWLSTSVPESRWSEPGVGLCSPEYQTNNLLSPVLFEEALLHVPEDAVLLEVAPHGLLQAILKRALPGNKHLALTQRGSQNGVHHALEAIGGLYSLGLNPVVSALCPEVSFPVSRGTPSLATLVSWDHVDRNTFLDRPAQDCKTTSTTTVTADSPFAEVNGRTLRPVAEIIMDVLSGFSRVMGDKHRGEPLTLSDVHIFSVVENPFSGEQVELTTSFLPGSGRFEMTDGSSGRLVMSGRVCVLGDDEAEVEAARRRRRRSTESSGRGRLLDGEQLYDELRASGIAYGHQLQVLQRVLVGTDEWEAESRPQLHAQLASALQLLQLASLTDNNAVAVPAVIGRMDILKGGEDGRLRLDKKTGYLESAWVRLENVEMRPLTVGSPGKNAHVRTVGAGQWQSPESLQIKIASVYSEEDGFVPGESVQLCGVAGEVAGGLRVMAVGMRVMSATDDRVRVDASLAWPVPEGWSDWQAAAATLPYCKAVYALRVVARASVGEAVLVHEAASPLGQAAVRVALELGCAPVLATVHGDGERDLLLAAFPELPSEDVFSLSSFEWRLRRRAVAVKVAVGAVTGEPLKATLRCMALWGRYVHCAPRRDARTATIGMNKFLDSLSLLSVPEDYLLTAGQDKRLALSEAVFEAVQDGTVQPILGDDDEDGDEDDDEEEDVDVEAPALQPPSAPGPRDAAALAKPRWVHSIKSAPAPSFESVVGSRPVCTMSTESIVEQGHRMSSESVHECKASTESVFESGYASLAESSTDLRRASMANLAMARADHGVVTAASARETEEAEARFSSCLPSASAATPRHRRSASLSSGRAGADGVRLRRVPSRCGRRSSSVAPQAPQARAQQGAQGAQVRTSSDSTEAWQPLPPPCREVFPLLALCPLGLPLDARGAADLRELASRLMMPVAAVEVPWGQQQGGGLAAQARAVVDALLRDLRQQQQQQCGPFNLLGWGPGTPLALEVARQLEAVAGAPSCTFLLDGDLRAVRSWAAHLTCSSATTAGGKLADLESLRPLLRDLGAHDADPAQSAPRRGRVIVLRGSNKDRSSLEGLVNVEVRTVQRARLDSRLVASIINGEAAWSRMAPEPTLRALKDSAL